MSDTPPPSRRTSGSRCPVCRAHRQPAPVCARCGADLSDLQRIEHRAAGECARAQRALTTGDFEAAAGSARLAVTLHATPRARQLAWLTEVVAATRRPSQRGGSK